MRSVVDVLRSHVRARSFTTNRPEIGAGTGGSGQSSLYACRSCDAVYIATEKQTCSSCRTAVERIPATLENT